MKQAVIVTPFDNYSYNVRIKYVEKYLEEKGYVCKIISSDFDHRYKCHYENNRSNLELLHVPEYKKNLSFNRIYSHYIFAKKTAQRLRDLNPDLIYGSAPPNFLFKYISHYKKLNPKTKLVYEIGDMWPETLPLSKKIKVVISPLLAVWSRLRNKYLKYADYIIYECNLFKESLQRYHPDTKCRTIYLCKEDFFKKNEFDSEGKSSISIAYVGSINNIIDIDLIIKVLKVIKNYRYLTFHIIGDGEKRDELIGKCSSENIHYIAHGILYDDEEKKQILENCQFGLNIMKNTVKVGATMKSLEYFHWGLGLINNIPADTFQIVNKYNCGLNIVDENDQFIEELAKKISEMSTSQLDDIRKNSRVVYNKMFSEATIKEKYMNVIKYLESM